MGQQSEAQIAAQTESALANQRYQQRIARDAEHAAKVSLAFLTLWKNHWAEGLSTCTANRLLIEAVCDEQMWDCSIVDNLEAAYNSVKSQLARVPIAERVPPTAPQPVTEPVADTVTLSEDEALRELARRFKGDPKGLAAAMRSILQQKDALNKSAALTLPAKYTIEVIRALPAQQLRELQTRYGSKILNDRLNGRS